TLLAAADLLRHREDLVFLFIGDGARRGEVLDAARANQAVRVLPYQPRSSLSFSLSAGDLHVVTPDENTAGLMEASKLYGVLAVGRPVLYIGPRGSEVARTVELERVGEVVSNGDAEGAAKAILELLENAERLGASARSCLVNRHSRHVRTAEFLRLI